MSLSAPLRALPKPKNSNQHPEQGTANRRFDFANAMLELLWVSDARDAQSERTRRTLLISSRYRTSPFLVFQNSPTPENRIPHA
jgi:hypothetical protein